MRYHFLAYAEDSYDYRASEDYVLDIYLKPTLKRIKFEKDRIDEFITDYVVDLECFFRSLSVILQKVAKEEKYYKVFFNEES